MHNPRIAIISFPGTNGDTENLRTFKRCGFDPFVFRWNDSREKLEGVDGYFIGAGFSYEDRGRAGMVAARDPIFKFLHEEETKGKVIVGHCNGCQVLVESGLIPFGDRLSMCMGHNVVESEAVGFLNQWVWITPSCKRDRCATSDWEGIMQIPIAHGEGRFTTKDKDLVEELQKNDQIAFQYCDAEGNVSPDAPITPNGAMLGIAGICNTAGNVVAIMPHPERTRDGDVYFKAMRRWIECQAERSRSSYESSLDSAPILRRAQDDISIQDCAFTSQELSNRSVKPLEIFIDTIIINNEERTVEQIARKFAPKLQLKQLRYLAPSEKSAEEILTMISLFNPNKESAKVRKGGEWYDWNADKKKLEEGTSPFKSWSLLRRDEPDTGVAVLGKDSQTGVCYTCDSVSDTDKQSEDLLNIFGNPHESVTELMT